MNAIEWLQDVPRRQGDRPFLIDAATGETVTFGEMHESAGRIAQDLHQRGFEPGDSLALVLHNSLAFAKLYFGCLYAGVVTVPINPVFGPADVEYLLTHAGAKACVYGESTRKAVEPYVASLPGGGLLLKDEAGDRGSGAESAWDLQALPASDADAWLAQRSPTDRLTVIHTSGTTGTPSGVAHRIADLVDNGRLFAKRLGIGLDNRFYGILAMTYLGGYYNLLLLPYVAESSVVLGRAFDARAALDFWTPAKEHGVNTLWLVPTILSILMEMDRGTAGEAFCREQVQLSLAGTAPLSPSLQDAFERRYGVTLHQNYGLSETLFITSQAPALPHHTGCVGHLLPGIQISLLDENANAVDYGTEGHIHVSTPHLMEGYRDPETGTLEPATGDWFPTGDLGRFQPTGELFITGRIKDLIIRGGINVSPAQIENILAEDERVLECAVVGIPHPVYGEDIAAAVRFADGADSEEAREALLSHCKTSLGSGKAPAHILPIDEFPKSSSGKIQKHRVRQLVLHALNLADEPSCTPTTAHNAVTKAILPGRIRRHIERPPAELVEVLSAFPTSIVSDCLNRLGVMDGGIRPLIPKRPFCGPAVTVEEVEGGNLMSHAALELLQAGDVLVIDGKGTETRSCFGGLQGLMAKSRGAVAIVVNGVIRDLDEFQDMEMPVYARGTSPGGPLKGWGGNVNLPLACGGVVVSPGDVVLGDDDGVVVIPRELASQVPPLCHARLAKEEGWFDAIRKGASTLDAVGLREKLSALGIEYV